MPKTTYQTVFHLYKTDDFGNPLWEWEMDEVDEFSESCADHLYVDTSDDFDILQYQYDLKKRFIDKYSSKQGYIHYYVEFNSNGYSYDTMNGTEYDVEIEIIKDKDFYLGEDWNEDGFKYEIEKEKIDKTRIENLVTRLNNLLKESNSIMQANKDNYKDVIRYILENYPVLLKNKMPHLYNSIEVKVDLEDLANLEFWDNPKNFE